MEVIDILGVPASPYTRKMLALMRYRQIPYRAIWGSRMDLPKGLLRQSSRVAFCVLLEY